METYLFRNICMLLLIRSANNCHVPYFLGLSPSFSGLPTTFPPVPDPFHVSFSYLHPFRLLLLASDLSRHPSLPHFRLFPSISLFLLASFQFSILRSDRSEFGSLLSIRLHSCSATIPLPVDLRVLLSSDLMTSVFPFELWSISYCSVLYITLASYVVSR